MSDSPAGQDASQPVWTDPVAELRGAVDHGVRRRAGRLQRVPRVEGAQAGTLWFASNGEARSKYRTTDGGRARVHEPSLRMPERIVLGRCHSRRLRAPRPPEGWHRAQRGCSEHFVGSSRPWMGVVKSRATPRVAKGKCSKEKRPHTHVHTHTGIVGSHAAPVSLFLCAAPQRYVPSAEQARL